MSALSRRKGQSGERELVIQIHAVTGWDVRRRVRQHAGDSDLEGVPGWSAESKRHSTATAGQVAAWWRQAVEQAQCVNSMPVLFYRADRCEWRAVWPLSALLASIQQWTDVGLTAETSIEAWAAVAREVMLAAPSHSPKGDL
jgi:hypothetical protein